MPQSCIKLSQLESAQVIKATVVARYVCSAKGNNEPDLLPPEIVQGHRQSCRNNIEPSALNRAWEVNLEVMSNFCLTNVKWVGLQLQFGQGTVQGQ